MPEPVGLVELLSSRARCRAQAGEEGGAAPAASGAAKPNPFGAARPREEVLKEQGRDYRVEELQLEHKAAEVLRYEPCSRKEERGFWSLR